MRGGEKKQLILVKRAPGAAPPQDGAVEVVAGQRKPVGKATDFEIVRRFRDRGVSVAALGYYHPGKRRGVEQVLRRALRGEIHVPAAIRLVA